MNNKGFTLVELLAVIVILSGIGLTAVFGITSSLEKQESNKIENEKEKAINAAKIYFSINDNKFVKIKTLKDDKYIEKIETISEDDYIIMCTDKYKYCEENEKIETISEDDYSIMCTDEYEYCE